MVTAARALYSLTAQAVEHTFLQASIIEVKPGAQQFVGDSAEWILERGTPFLPKFGAITFDLAGSCNARGTIVGKPADGIAVTLVDGLGNMQTAEKVTEDSVSITDLFN